MYRSATMGDVDKACGESNGIENAIHQVEHSNLQTLHVIGRLSINELQTWNVSIKINSY